MIEVISWVFWACVVCLTGAALLRLLSRFLSGRKASAHARRQADIEALRRALEARNEALEQQRDLVLWEHEYQQWKQETS